LAHDKLLARSDAQALAYKFLHEDEDRLPPDQQQSFIDLRRSQQEAENLEKALGEKGVPSQATTKEAVKNEEPVAREKSIMIVDDTREENEAENSDEEQPMEAPEKRQKTEEIGKSVSDETSTESRGRSSQRTESRARDKEARSRSRPAQASRDDSNQLLETWNRTGVTGRGVGILERSHRN
jgi:hypothetical protein